MLKKFIFIIILLFSSCASTALKDEILREKDRLKNTIFNTFPKNIKITIYQFKNNSEEKDLDYLSKAIQEMIYTFLKPIEAERVYVDLSNFIFTPSETLEIMLQDTNSLFTNYLTPVEKFVTQGIELIITNSNRIKIYITNTNSDNIYITNIITNKINYSSLFSNVIKKIKSTNAISSNLIKYYNYDVDINEKLKNILIKSEDVIISEKELTNLSPKEITNFSNYIITDKYLIYINTNLFATNIIKTNIMKLTVENYSNLILKEFPYLTYTICNLPIFLQK